MDKKLSDNEIVKALDNDCLCVVYGVDCESCPLREKDCKILPEAIKDLIHRLQSENKELRTESDRMVAEHLAFTELAEKADEQQKAEIAELKAQCSKSSYRDSWKNKFFKAQEEIERLTKLAELRLRDNQDTCNLLVEKEKQVDELKEKLWKSKQDMMTYHSKTVAEAVKDTAKEICDLILEHWEKKQFVECDWLRVTISERYGVEVE